MSNLLLVIIGLVILLCIIILLFVIKNLNSSKIQKDKEEKSNINNASLSINSNSNTNYNFVDIKDIELPKKIASLDNRELFKACKAVYDSFKALDYKNRANSKLSSNEWHSWQVSLLIAFQKSKREFHVGNVDDVFDRSTLEMGSNSLNEAIKKIWKKYNQNVNISLDRDSLSNDIIWSSREVSTMLYYMTKVRY